MAGLAKDELDPFAASIITVQILYTAICIATPIRVCPVIGVITYSINVWLCVSILVRAAIVMSGEGTRRCG
jgi:hypothetical protein